MLKINAKFKYDINSKELSKLEFEPLKNIIKQY